MDKPQFIWTQDYSVGIKEIDEQHQHFFGVANAIVENSGKIFRGTACFNLLANWGIILFIISAPKNPILINLIMKMPHSIL